MWKNFLILSVCLLINGCAVFNHNAQYAIKKQTPQIKQAFNDHTELMNKKVNNFHVEKSLFLGNASDKMVLSQKIILPEIFSHQITLVSEPMYLQELFQKITKITGYKIELQYYRPKTKGSSSENSYLDLIKTVKIPVLYRSTLTAILDNIASYYNIFWEFQPQKQTIRFYKVKTKIYTLASNLGKLQTHSILSNESSVSKSDAGESSSSAGIKTSQSTKTGVNFDTWKNVLNGIQLLLSSSGQISENEAIGIISVTDTPTVLTEIDSYIKQLNQKLSRQVAITVKVYRLELTDTTNVDFNLTAAFQELGDNSNYKIGLTSVPHVDASVAMGGLNAVILSNPASKKKIEHFKDSSFLLSALAKYGKTTLVTSGSGITLNNQPMPIQNIKQIGYLSSVTRSTNDSDTTDSELTPGYVTTGFSMIVTPHIINANTVFLQYNINLSALDSMDTITSGDSNIQAPQISTKSFMQRLKMKMGQTLFLAGFRQNKNAINRGAGIAGYGKTGEKSQTILVVSITINKA